MQSKLELGAVEEEVIRLSSYYQCSQICFKLPVVTLSSFCFYF